jgi:class 3 adenylate cyclase
MASLPSSMCDADRIEGILRSMSGLPSGTVTFVFSDIEGSTALLKVLGDRYGNVLSDHRRLMRECFTAQAGVEIDTQGDAFFFAFPRAKDAVSAAVEAQRRHAKHAWTDGQTVRVRMGLHTGEPAVGSEGYLGIDVVRAARLCTVGRGGQVLLSETTRALVGGSLPEGVSVHTLGERLLKDIDEPEHIFELDIEGSAIPEAEVTPGPPEPRSRPVSPSPQGPPIPPDFGARLADRIQEHVRRTVEEPLERMFSVDALADRASEHPETITEKLDIEDGSPDAAPEAQQGKRNGTPH